MLRGTQTCVTEKINATERSSEKAVTTRVIKQRYPLSNHSRHGRVPSAMIHVAYLSSKIRYTYIYGQRLKIKKFLQDVQRLNEETRQLVKLRKESTRIHVCIIKRIIFFVIRDLWSAILFRNLRNYSLRRNNYAILRIVRFVALNA